MSSAYKFETKELKTRTVSLIVCLMIAMFMGAGAFVFMLVSEYYLIGAIAISVCFLPLIIWKIIYMIVDKNIYKRIANSKDSITTVEIVVGCKYYKNSKRDNSGKEVYSTSVQTGEDCGDKILERFYISTEKFKRGDFVEIKFIREQYNNCLITRKANFEEYKSKFSPEYWDGYEGNGSDLLIDLNNEENDLSSQHEEEN